MDSFIEKVKNDKLIKSSDTLFISASSEANKPDFPKTTIELWGGNRFCIENKLEQTRNVITFEDNSFKLNNNAVTKGLVEKILNTSLDNILNENIPTKSNQKDLSDAEFKGTMRRFFQICDNKKVPFFGFDIKNARNFDWLIPDFFTIESLREECKDLDMVALSKDEINFSQNKESTLGKLPDEQYLKLFRTYAYANMVSKFPGGYYLVDVEEIISNKTVDQLRESLSDEELAKAVAGLIK